MTWSRPTELVHVEPWHLVREIVGGAIVTHCRGRWPTVEPHEESEKPPFNERCGYCQQARVELGLRELRDSMPVARHQPTSDDWDLSDMDGGEA